MPETKTVGSELLNEIARVSANRARWIEYGRNNAELAMSMGPALLLMEIAVERGKSAVQSDDPAEAISALENLRRFDSND
jgi:hypothetical protein